MLFFLRSPQFGLIAKAYVERALCSAVLRAAILVWADIFDASFGTLLLLFISTSKVYDQSQSVV